MVVTSVLSANGQTWLDRRQTMMVLMVIRFMMSSTFMVALHQQVYKAVRAVKQGSKLPTSSSHSLGNMLPKFSRGRALGSMLSVCVPM